MKALYLASLLISAVAGQAYGTCVTGQDPIGQLQSCRGRCHIYHPGDYGACFSYQFTDDDVNGTCGTADKPCKSTFNAGWDTQKVNCGNCYYVEKKYADGTVLSTYIKVMDTNGSDSVKFEMAQNAWKNLCPYGCAATGECAHTASQCQHGVLPDSGMPGPCYVQYEDITFKRVECGQSGGNGAPTLPPFPPGGNPPTAPHPPGGNNPPTAPHPPGGNNPPTAPHPPGGNAGNCESQVGNRGNPAWDAECKSLCSYYSSNMIFCQGYPDLVSCLVARHAYCRL